jgi:glutamate dehydrogenase
MAFAAVRDAYGMSELNGALDDLDTRIDGGLQLKLYARIQDLLLSRVVWFVRNVDISAGLDAIVSRFRGGIGQIAAALDAALPADAAAARAKVRQDLEAAGVPAETALRLADLDVLAAAPDIVLVAERTGTPLADAAATNFAAQAVFRLDRLAEAARDIPANDYYERLAVDRAVDQIAAAERRLVADMLGAGTAGSAAVEAWLDAHPEAARIRRSVEEIAAGGLTLAKLTVAANLLGDLVKA